MKTKDALEHYGTKSAMADGAKVRPQAVAKWGKRPPGESQMRIHKDTHGKLKADSEVIAYYRDLTEGVL